MDRKPKKPDRTNPVAKFAVRFHRDKTKYQRRAKHRGQGRGGESFAVQAAAGL